MKVKDKSNFKDKIFFTNAHLNFEKRNFCFFFQKTSIVLNQAKEKIYLVPYKEMNIQESIKHSGKMNSIVKFQSRHYCVKIEINVPY